MPALTVDGPVTARENELVTVIVPMPLLDESAALMAVREMPGGAVRICGAVYVPEESTVPHAAPVHPLLEITQMTDRLGLPAEFTVAVNGREAPSSTGIVSGETETETSLVIVTSEVEVLEVSAALVACTDTETRAGRFAGAVYTPPVSIVPTVALPPGIPFTLQLTDVFAVLLTVAVKVCGSPSGTDAVVGATVTVTGGGGGGGPDPTSPPQPRNEATRGSAGRQ